MFLCGDVLYIQIKKWYVKFGATGSLTELIYVRILKFCTQTSSSFLEQS